MSGGVTMRTGPVPFALPMRAGRQYVIEVEVGVMTGPTGSGRIVGYERDAEGKTLAEFGPVKTEAELQRCQDSMAAAAAAAPAP